MSKKKRKTKKAAKREASKPDLAIALVKAARAQADCRVPAHDLITREKMAKGTRSAQAELLRQMSPAAADAWEADRASAA